MEKLGNRLLELLNSGVDLLQSELPLFVSELLLWKTAATGVSMLIFVVITIIGYRWAKRIKIKTDEEMAVQVLAENETHVIKGIVGGVCVVMFGLMGIFELFELIQITIAPRIWLLEYASDLISPKH